uniref:Uncharacterized protein n=1 Tax=Serinus canaria TaxID=9135 RepID=A0A8C9N574_SERCA
MGRGGSLPLVPGTGGSRPVPDSGGAVPAPCRAGPWSGPGASPTPSRGGGGGARGGPPGRLKDRKNKDKDKDKAQLKVRDCPRAASQPPPDPALMEMLRRFDLSWEYGPCSGEHTRQPRAIGSVPAWWVSQERGKCLGWLQLQEQPWEMEMDSSSLRGSFQPGTSFPGKVGLGGILGRNSSL